tara:strand:- start:394 stop:1110 length:717 start_codon:yes stop_codon:yes gene_type:complete
MSEKKIDWKNVNWDRRFYDRLKGEPAKVKELMGQVVPHMRPMVAKWEAEWARLAPLIEGLTFEDYKAHRTSKEGPIRFPFIREWQKLFRDISEATLPRIPIEDCIHGHVYRLHSRNLIVGAWHEGERGFSGIREKFGSRYIFMEYHWDHTHFPTARPLEDLRPLPEGILPDDYLGSFTDAGREVWWDREAADEEHKLGRQRYKDTNEFCDEPARRESNLPLFEYLDGLEIPEEGKDEQ